MALECAHCGTRVADGAKRCPQCLRSTALVEIPVESPGAAKARATRTLVAVGVAVVVAAAGGFAAWRFAWKSRRPTEGSALARAVLTDRDTPDPFATGPAAAASVARVRASSGDLVRARTALEIATSRLGTTRLVEDPHDAPAARRLDDIVQALAASDGRVTSLDLARLIVGMLRAAGTRARVAQITAGMRPGEPAEPTGLLGRYAAIVGDTAVDVYGRTLLGARELHAAPIDDSAVRGAMLAQSALNAAYAGAPHDRVVALADGAVAAWREGPVPLAVRAEAWRIAGATGGLSLADQDLASAIAARDDAPLHLLRARFALQAGRGDLVMSETRAALARSPSFGPAALATAITGVGAVDGGDRCGALRDSGESWAPFAWTLCRGAAPGTSTLSVPEAAQRLAASSSDPMVLAYAAAAGAEGVFGRVRTSDRDELVAWLSALGRDDLVRAANGASSDAGR